MRIYERFHQFKKEEITKLLHYPSDGTTREAQDFQLTVCQDH